MKKKNKFARILIILALVTLILTVILIFLVSNQQRNRHGIEIDPETIKLIQLEDPKPGDPVAIVETTLGEFRFRLFPEQSPNAVRNFIELAESGFYNDTYVFNAENGVYSCMGSKQKNGEISADSDPSHEKIERELCQDLWSFRGAVCAMNTEVERTFSEKLLGGGTYYNGSRFEILNTVELTDEERENLLANSENRTLGQAYLDMGGIPNFAQQMTVIGQIYEGLDVAEQLTAVETESNGRYKLPKEDIRVISVTISEYKDNA